ncbi:MAG: hypothetical protein ABI867_37030, partial [Kofleriaceae bacterium]
LAPLLASSLVRRLEHLTLTATYDTDAVCAVLAGIRRPSLRELDLSHGALTDDGARVLAGAELELDILDVSFNHLTSRGRADLDRIAKLVIADRQSMGY